MKKSLSLVEVMIAVVILVFALTAILASYANMFILAELSRDSGIAVLALAGQMEELRRTGFDNLDSLNGTNFALGGFTAGNSLGRIEVRTIAGYLDLREVRLVAAFRSRQRIIGEDQNLNGVLDTASGEDLNNNSQLDSSVELITVIAR